MTNRSKLLLHLLAPFAALVAADQRGAMGRPAGMLAVGAGFAVSAAVDAWLRWRRTDVAPWRRLVSPVRGTWVLVVVPLWLGFAALAVGCVVVAFR